MNPALVNVVIGIVQVAGPAAITYAISQHWISADTISGIVSIAAALGLTWHSAATTTAVSK